MAKGIGRKILKVLGWLLLVVVVLLVVVRIAAPSIAVGIANKQLPKQLNAEASLRDIDLSLLRGRVAVQDLHIGQPAGFEGDTLLHIPELSVDVSVPSLMKGPITVQSVRMNGATVNIAKNAEGVMNVDALVPAKEEAEEEAPAEEEQPSEPKAIRIDEVSISGLHVSFSDASGGGDPMKVELDPLDIEVANVLVDPAAAPGEEMPGTAQVTATLVQEPFPAALLGVIARIGVIGTGVPAVNAAVRLCGLELDPLSSVVPAGTAQMIGGETLDLSVDLAMADDVLDCSAEVRTAGNAIGMAVGGTPHKPEVDKSGALFGVLGFAGGGVAGTAVDVGEAGVAAAGAAVDTAATVGKGALRTAGTLGGGLFKSVKGVAKGDLKGAAKGLQDTAKGAATDAVDTVGEAAETAAEGVGEAAATTVGSDDAAQWREQGKERWDGNWKAARKRVADMPFPRPAHPATEEAAE